MRLVLDTNVLVSALLSPNGAPAKVWSLVSNGTCSMVTSSEILDEYRDVLFRREFHFRPDSLTLLLDYFERETDKIETSYSGVKFIDESDRKFYEAMEQSCVKYLITGNLRHFPRDQRIISPAEFLKIWHSY